MKSTFQKLTAFLFCSFLCNSLHATDMDDDSSSMLIPTLIIAILVVSGIVIFYHFKEKKRKIMITEEEQSSTDFNCSNSIGNMNVKMYFDPTKDKVQIKRFCSKGIVTEYIESFSLTDNSFVAYKYPYFCAYDAGRGNALVGHFEYKEVKYGVVNVFNNHGANEKRNETNIRPTLEYVRFQQHFDAEIVPQPFWLIEDQTYNMLAIISINSSVEKIQYSNCNQAEGSVKTISTIKKLYLGKYVLLQDDALKKLVIIDNGKFVTINYSDIIEVSYEENGETIFSSSSPSIGGAIVGGALFGTAGAVIGGLGNRTTQQSRKVRNMDVKILLRNHSQSSYVLSFMDMTFPLPLNKTFVTTYNRYLGNAKQAKDLISVIMDKVKQQEQQNKNLTVQAAINNNSGNSVADELTKLLKLKEAGVLSEEEFKSQKAKLLG